MEGVGPGRLHFAVGAGVVGGCLVSAVMRGVQEGHSVRGPPCSKDTKKSGLGWTREIEVSAFCYRCGAREM